ncbi:MAG: hypothetical protein LBQ84_01530 [Flavobacteriaceae bacterium]|jgi:hypothetical protein|nr:hypothetical protein [Flavobacteriaceae bacterium]
MNPFLILFILTLCSCGLKNDADKKADNTIEIKKKVDKIPIDSITSIKLDEMLKCDEYTYGDGYYTIPYNGCIYDSIKDNLGKSYIFLIPKDNTIDDSNVSDELIDKETQIVNNSSVEDIKEKYNIAIFLIEVKYLKKYVNAEETFYQEFPYVEKYISYNFDLKQWELIDEFSIKNIDAEQKMDERMWYIVETLK